MLSKRAESPDRYGHLIQEVLTANCDVRPCISECRSALACAMTRGATDDVGAITADVNDPTRPLRPIPDCGCGFEIVGLLLSVPDRRLQNARFSCTGGIKRVKPEVTPIGDVTPVGHSFGTPPNSQHRPPHLTIGCETIVIDHLVPRCRSDTTSRGVVPLPHHL